MGDVNSQAKLNGRYDYYSLSEIELQDKKQIHSVLIEIIPQITSHMINLFQEKRLRRENTICQSGSIRNFAT